MQPVSYVTNAQHVYPNLSLPTILQYPLNGSAGSSTPQISHVYVLRHMQEEIRFVSESDIASFSTTSGYRSALGNTGINLRSCGLPLQGQGQIEHIDMETGLQFDAVPGAVHENDPSIEDSTDCDNRVKDATYTSSGQFNGSSDNSQEENSS